MTFGRFMSYYKRTNFIEKFYNNCNLKTSPMPSHDGKKISTTSTGKQKLLKQANYINGIY